MSFHFGPPRLKTPIFGREIQGLGFLPMLIGAVDVAPNFQHFRQMGVNGGVVAIGRRRGLLQEGEGFLDFTLFE